jgi:hypothetical protein
MSDYKLAERERAIARGVEFIYRTARKPENFALYGYDYLCCFDCISGTSLDEGLKRTARRMGRVLARRWRKQNPAVPRYIGPGHLINLVIGADAAERLGIPDSKIKRQIRSALSRFTTRELLWFDPVREPPPPDMPEPCECGVINPRGSLTCAGCNEMLAQLGRYGAWLDALIRSYIGERYGVTLGARYCEVIKWLPSMRRYSQIGKDDPEFYYMVYAVTHVVYTLNDYHRYRLSPRWLPQEFSFLKKNLERAISIDDPEMVGEFLDTLRAFGLSAQSAVVRRGIEYLLACQNPDGSWGDVDAKDIYLRHHPTWTAIDGLREYAWQGERLSFPELMPMLEKWAEVDGV